MSEWEETRVSEVISEIAMGPFGSNIKVGCFVQEGIPVLNGSNLVGFRLNDNSLRYVTPDKADSLGRANASKGDVVVTHRGTLGQIVYIPASSKHNRYVISQSQFRLRCNNRMIPEFFVYYFHSREGQNKLLSNASQVGVPALAQATTTFQNLTIPCPPLSTQRRIAAVLSALDDKIELNNRVNANLEAQAQALFRSWFVDFEPWGGEMPSGWRIRSLSDIAEFYPGYSYKSSELVESDMAMATIKNYCRGGGFKLDGYKEIKPLKTPKPTQVVDVFDTLVAHTDVTQNADIVGNAELILSKGRFKEIIASMDLVKVSPKQGVSKFLLGAILKSPAFKEHCLQFVNGTTVLHLSKQALPKYEVAFPDDCRSVQPLADALECLFRKMALNIEASDRLASLRDALLPKLMRGEIDAEKVEVAG